MSSVLRPPRSAAMGTIRTEMQLGPVRFAVDPKSEAAQRSFAHKLVVRETRFRIPSGGRPGIQEMYAALVADERRNQLILDDIIQALEQGRSPILLTERKDHLEYFATRLEKLARHLIVLQGGVGAKERREAKERLAAIPNREERLVLATGRYVGEGFDDARLDTLFLALPVSWKRTLIQYTGRLHRLHPGKTEVRIFDYVDRDVPMLLRMFEKGLRGYRAIGYARGRGAARLCGAWRRGGRRVRRGCPAIAQGLGRLRMREMTPTSTPKTKRRKPRLRRISKRVLEEMIEEATVDC